MRDDWEPCSLGVERMDVEHRQIVRRVRGLVAAAAAARADEVRSGLRFLATYLAHHWCDEDAWMAEQGYPAAREHGRGHARLLARIAAARDDAATEGVRLEAAVRAAAELAHGVEEHMRVEDLKLARFFTARENLRLLALASPGKGPALTPIPGSATPVPRPVDRRAQGELDEAAPPRQRAPAAERGSAASTDPERASGPRYIARPPSTSTQRPSK